MFEAGVLNGLTRISIEISSSKSRSDDDFTDRLNHSYTTTILMLCTLVVLARQFIGKPISCWTPNEFTAPQVEYATLMCWVTSTYFIPPNQATIPADLQLRHRNSIRYYQWVPFLLMLQAALFSVPCIVWRLFNWQSRIHLWTIMELASKSGDVGQLADARASHVHFVVRHLEDALVMRHRRKQNLRSQNSTSSSAHTSLSSPLLEPTKMNDKYQYTPWYEVLPLIISERSRVPCPRPCSPSSSSYLVGLYLIVKVLYIFNSAGQIFLTERFLGQSTILYGVHMLTDLMTGDQWQHTGNFPRVTFCDFDMRRMGSNYHRHTLQCVLGINMFNEKIFIFLWFWLVLITILNINSFLRWTCKSTFESNRISFIRSLLVHRQVIGKEFGRSPTSTGGTSNSTPTDSSTSEISSHVQLSDSERKASAFFTEHVLGQDGVFVIRLVSFNVGCQVAAQIVEYVWTRYAQASEKEILTKKTNVDGTSFRVGRLVMPLPPLPVRTAQPALPVRLRYKKSGSLTSQGDLVHEPVGPDRSPPVDICSRRRVLPVRNHADQVRETQWSSGPESRSDPDPGDNDISSVPYNQDSLV